MCVQIFFILFFVIINMVKVSGAKGKKSATGRKSGMVLPPTSVPAIYRKKNISFNQGRRVLGLVWGHWDLENLRPTSWIRYGNFGHEFTKTTNEPHTHFYLEFTKNVRRNRVIKLLGEAWEHKQGFLVVPNGTWEHAVNYHGKDEDAKFVEWGEPAAIYQGQRTDLHSFRDHFKNGGTVQEAVESEHITCVAKYPRLMNLCVNMYSKHRTQHPEVYYLWGPSRTGKSHYAEQEALKHGSFYNKPVCEDWKWWPNYNQETSVIIEDFRGRIPLDFMLVLCDRYQLQVRIFGGYAKFNSPRIYITANAPIDRVWENNKCAAYDESLKAFKNRVTKSIHFSYPYWWKKCSLEEAQEKQYIKEDVITADARVW